MSIRELSKLLESYYQQLGVYAYDVVYIYSDLRGFASQLTEEVSRDDLFQAVVAPLLDKGTTILTPTFTYTTSGAFEVTETQTKLGAMNKWFLSQDEVSRSEHPLFSDAALGPQSALVENVGKSAFGAESVFDRLHNRGCGFLHLGHDLSKHGNTVIHHVEQMCGATYRLHKAFETKVYRCGDYIGADYTAFLRRRDVPRHDFVYYIRKSIQGYERPGPSNRDRGHRIPTLPCDLRIRRIGSAHVYASVSGSELFPSQRFHSTLGSGNGETRDREGDHNVLR